MHLATNHTLVINNMKHRISNILQHKKMMLKLIIFSMISLLTMAMLPSLLNMATEMPTPINPSLTNNQLENNQPADAPTTSTGSHPLKNSPASTNISNKA
uniref:Female-specific orf protein n=1 Tax=Reginaia ebena TaxID=131227 RepID=F4ZFF5_9BIVA|nr:female-specific orf protein [Reginaia ebena]